MGVQQSSKQGVQSESQKRDTARYMDETAPNATPVAGAFGREEGPESFPVADRASVLAADEEEEDLDDELDDDEDDDLDDDDDEDDDDLDEDEDA